MSFPRRLLLGIGFLAGMAVSTAHGQTSVIDNFEDIFTLPISNAEVVFHTVSAANLLGGHRTLSISQTTHNGAATASAAGSHHNTNFSVDAGATAVFTLEYDGDALSAFNPLGLGGINFTLNGVNGISFLEAFDGPTLLSVEIFDMSGRSSKGELSLFDRFVPAESTFLFDDLVGHADLTNVGALRVVINEGNRPALDGVFGPILFVPETGSAALFFVSLSSWIGFVRRSRKPRR